MSQPKETLKFRIGLSGTFWDKVPQFSILVNNKVYESGSIDNKATQYFEFTTELEENQIHELKIRLENKSNEDTVQNETKTAIIKDLLLNIDSIEIDDIELDQIKWSASEFVPDDSTRPRLDNCVNLGWNGAYVIQFTSPFYLWLLENM